MQTTQHRFVALVLSTLFTLTMLVSVDQLATSQPPAGLLAQVAATTSHG